MTIADVIFPGFASAYVIPFLILPATLMAIASEVVVFRIREPQAPRGPAVLLVIVANLLSWLVGMAITWYLPSGLIPAIESSGLSRIKPGPMWTTYSIASWILAWILTCAIEFGVLFSVRRWVGFTRLFGTVILANLISYPVFGLGVVVLYMALHPN